MGRHKVFTFKVNQNERQLIATLAEHLRRSQSDAVRFVVLEAAREFERNHAAPTEHNATQVEAMRNAIA